MQSGDRFWRDKQEVRLAVADFLAAAFANLPQNEVVECSRYVTLAGGHRWRAIVSIAAGRIFDDDSLAIGLPGACGVELAHAASLILDDLPSMDDASIRRGKPCAHLVFPRWAVDMAPIGLVSMAYAISLANERVAPDRRVETALLLSDAATRMIHGQTDDMRQDAPEGDKEDWLLARYAAKSGYLYSAAAKAGALSCGAEWDDAEAVGRAGLHLGISYQLMDDVADATAATGEVGKDVGKDSAKWTAINWLGVEGARAKSLRFRDLGLEELSRFGARADWLRSLVGEASYAVA